MLLVVIDAVDWLSQKPMYNFYRRDDHEEFVRRKFAGSSGFQPLLLVDSSLARLVMLLTLSRLRLLFCRFPKDC